MTFHLMCVHIILVRFRLLSDHLLGISCYSVDHIFSFVFWLFVILVISRFGFEDWILVLTASFPDFCTLLTFRSGRSTTDLGPVVRN